MLNIMKPLYLGDRRLGKVYGMPAPRANPGQGIMKIWRHLFLGATMAEISLKPVPRNCDNLLKMKIMKSYVSVPEGFESRMVSRRRKKIKTG